MRFTFGRWKLLCLSLCLIGLQPPSTRKPGEKLPLPTPTGFTRSDDLHRKFSAFVHEVGHPDGYVDITSPAEGLPPG
jgi:hypothetical protein